MNLKTGLSTEDKTGEVGRTAVEQEAGAAGSQAKGFGFFGAVETKPLQKCRRADRKLGLVQGARERQKGAVGTVAKRRGPPCSLTSGHCRLRELAREIPFRLVCAIFPVSNVGGWFPMSRTLDGPSPCLTRPARLPFATFAPNRRTQFSEVTRHRPSSPGGAQDNLPAPTWADLHSCPAARAPF